MVVCAAFGVWPICAACGLVCSWVVCATCGVVWSWVVCAACGMVWSWVAWRCVACGVAWCPCRYYLAGHKDSQIGVATAGLVSLQCIMQGITAKAALSIDAYGTASVLLPVGIGCFLAGALPVGIGCFLSGVFCRVFLSSRWNWVFSDGCFLSGTPRFIQKRIKEADDFFFFLVCAPCRCYLAGRSHDAFGGKMVRAGRGE